MNFGDILFLVLLNSVWQAAIIAALTWIPLRVISRTNAETRYIAWSFAFLGCIAVPLLTVPQLVKLPIPSVSVTAIDTAWAIIALVMLARIVVGITRLSRVKRIAFPVDGDLRSRLTQWEPGLSALREPRLCVSDEVDIPVAVGLLDAMVLLPEWIVRDCSPADIDRLVAHELSHLRRYDDWSKLAQAAFEAIFFFNPAIRWIGAQLDVEREVACDDAAVNDDNRAGYAASLMRLARSVNWVQRFALAPNLYNARRTLSLRVERLLGARHGRGISARAIALSSAASLGAFVAIQAISPLATFAFTVPQDDPAIHQQAQALYERLQAHNFPAPTSGSAQRYFPKAEAILAAMGRVKRFSLTEAHGDTFIYRVQAAHGQALMHVTADRAHKLAAFSIDADASRPGLSVLRAYLAEVLPTPPPSDAANIQLSMDVIARIGDQVWPGWSKTLFAIDLITANGPVEVNFAKPFPAPSFPPQLEATFPWPNGVPTIVIGQPQFTQANTPIRWSVTVMHEHFHQWQYTWPKYVSAVKNLGLAPPGDTNAMWMLNYPFPYKNPRVDNAYGAMARKLADALAGNDVALKANAKAYLSARAMFKSLLNPKDYRYFAFQCWQEGTARYTEFSAAHLAAITHALDTSFLTDAQAQGLAADAATTYARIIRSLRNSPLQDGERVNFYALGGGEALLLDRVSPGWRTRYLDPRMDLSNFFQR